MLKITYKTSNLFSLKKYNDSNLNCRSYLYPTTYAIRSAILGTVITLDGIKRAKELFPKIKNATIFTQMPNKYKVNGVKLKRFSNSYYNMKEEDKVDRDTLIKKNFSTTMGFREHIHLEEIVFYIDRTIPDIEIYLKNIDILGHSEGMVFLSSIEEVANLRNVLVKWPQNDESVDLYENWDWSSKTKFDEVYFFSPKYSRRNQVRSMNEIKSISL